MGHRLTDREVAELLTLPVPELMKRFPDKSRNHIMTLRRYYKKKLEGRKMETGETAERLSRINELLQNAGVDPQNIGRINRVNVYQGYIKNKEDEIETKDLYSIQFTPAGGLDQEQFISQAAPTVVRPTKKKPVVRRDRQALIVTDAQMWMGRTMAGELYPFHDERAMGIVEQIAHQEQPDDIIIVGDFADFPTVSRFRQEPAYQDTLNPSLNAMHQWLAKLRANAPNANMHLLEGNHELRLRRYVYDQARQLYGLRRAGEDQQVLDLRFLLRLDELEIEWHDGYPNGQYWLNDRLKVVHGNTVKQLGKTVTNLIRNDDTSSITGHIHRFEMATRTIPTRHAGRIIQAASFGTLSRIDGAVPSAHSSLDAQAEPMRHIEQWQQGAGVVYYEPGDRPFDIQPIVINTFDNYQTRFNGRVYE